MMARVSNNDSLYVYVDANDLGGEQADDGPGDAAHQALRQQPRAMFATLTTYTSGHRAYLLLAHQSLPLPLYNLTSITRAPDRSLGVLKPSLLRVQVSVSTIHPTSAPAAQLHRDSAEIPLVRPLHCLICQPQRWHPIQDLIPRTSERIEHRGSERAGERILPVR